MNENCHSLRLVGLPSQLYTAAAGTQVTTDPITLRMVVLPDYAFQAIGLHSSSCYSWLTVKQLIRQNYRYSATRQMQVCSREYCLKDMDVTNPFQNCTSDSPSQTSTSQHLCMAKNTSLPDIPTSPHSQLPKSFYAKQCNLAHTIVAQYIASPRLCTCSASRVSQRGQSEKFKVLP